jgi:hypothetical protein
MSPASDPPAEAFPPESSGTPENSKARPDTLPDMLPAHRVAKAALPPALPTAGTPGQNLPAPVAPAGPFLPQRPAAPAPTRGEGWSGARADDDHPYGPGTSRGPASAGSFGGGAYHGPTGGGYSQDYAESAYVEPHYEEPHYEEPRQPQGNTGHQEANSWFAARDQPKPDYPAYGGGHHGWEYPNEGYPGGGYGGQGPQPWQGGYQGEGFAAQQPAPGQAAPGQAAPGQAAPGQLPTRSQTPPPPVPPNAQGYRDQSAAGYPGPSGGYSAQPSQFGNGYPGRPAADFPPPNGFPPPANVPPGFPAPPRQGEFQGYPPPNFPGGQPPGFSGQQAEGFQQTAAFPGPQPGIANQQAGAFPGFGQPSFAGAQFGQMPFGGPVGGPPAPSATAATPWYQRLGSGKPRLLIGGAVAVVVVAGGAALAVPKLLGSSDPGCASYTGTALTAYNQTINDLNAQASQSQLTSDMTTAIADLSTAADQAQSATVKSALDGLLSELSIVRADVQKGSVPAQAVTALNSASRTADNAC